MQACRVARLSTTKLFAVYSTYLKRIHQHSQALNTTLKSLFFPHSSDSKNMFKTHPRKIPTAQAGIVKLKTNGHKLVTSIYVNPANDC